LFEAKREKFLWEVIKGFNVLLKTHRKEHSAVLYTKGALTPAKFSEYREIIKQQHLSYDVNLNLEHKVRLGANLKLFRDLRAALVSLCATVLVTVTSSVHCFV
jgi:hypothetical protein